MGLGATRHVLSRVDSFSAAQCRGCFGSCPYGTDFSFQATCNGAWMSSPHFLGSIRCLCDAPNLDIIYNWSSHWRWCGLLQMIDALWRNLMHFPPSTRLLALVILACYPESKLNDNWPLPKLQTFVGRSSGSWKQYRRKDEMRGWMSTVDFGKLVKKNIWRP